MDLTRRDFLGHLGAGIVSRYLGPVADLWADQAEKAPARQRYRIGVCDWMILKRQRPGAFELASRIGVDGVEVDMGPLGDRETFESRLADPGFRGQFLTEAHRYRLEICSIAMSGFYAQSFAERPTVQRMIHDCIETAKILSVKVAFLPLGVRGDLIKYPQLRPIIVERLKAAGAMAEQVGVTIGLETSLDAAGDLALLEQIGSPAIRIYFNFANAVKAKRDICSELQVLGKDRICQIHCTNEDGLLLQDDPQIDMPKIKRTLDLMGWAGWLVLERSRSAKNPHDVVGNFGSNARYVRSVFQAG